MIKIETPVKNVLRFQPKPLANVRKPHYQLSFRNILFVRLNSQNVHLQYNIRTVHATQRTRSH